MWQFGSLGSWAYLFGLPVTCPCSLHSRQPEQLAVYGECVLHFNGMRFCTHYCLFMWCPLPLLHLLLPDLLSLIHQISFWVSAFQSQPVCLALRQYIVQTPSQCMWPCDRNSWFPFFFFFLPEDGLLEDRSSVFCVASIMLVHSGCSINIWMNKCVREEN